MTGPGIRRITPQDVPAVVAMVHALADYERAADECQLTEEQLRAALFGASPALFGHVATDPSGTPVGFALWFLNFSTWRGVHGIYLEDLYVRPEARGGGLGRRLLATLATICVERGYGRLDWSVLDWNTPARRVYDALGGTPLDEWLPYRLAGEALVRLAEAAPGESVAGSRHAAGSRIDPQSS
jgi:GNAT superfamily N-acetyltransferase